MSAGPWGRTLRWGRRSHPGREAQWTPGPLQVPHPRLPQVHRALPSPSRPRGAQSQALPSLRSREARDRASRRLPTLVTRPTAPSASLRFPRVRPSDGLDVNEGPRRGWVGLDGLCSGPCPSREPGGQAAACGCESGSGGGLEALPGTAALPGWSPFGRRPEALSETPFS